MRFDVRYMSTDELEDHLQNQLVQKDVVAYAEVSEEGVMMEEASETSEQDFPRSRE
jgi:hypothetical protein